MKLTSCLRFFYVCFFIVSSLFFQVTDAFAQPAGWSYTRPFAVTENSGALVTNYQLRIVFDSQTPIANGQMNANGDDIRFGNDCNGTILFNYWIESGINTANTVVWVKMDSLFASATRTFYMYHGNSSAPGVSSIPLTFNGINSGTDSTANTSLSGSSDAQRGFRFAPTEDILVTSFGKSEPNGLSRYITLFDVGTQGILRQEQVSGPAAMWSYAPISSPIWLTQGTQYLLEIFFPFGSDAYYFGAAPTVGQHITYFDMRYCNGCTQNTYPNNVLGGMLYGYVDFWYYTKKNITPAPTYVMGSGLSVNVVSSDDTICVGNSVLIGDSAEGGIEPYTYSWSPVTGLSSTTDALVTATPTGTIHYLLTATDACGTIKSDSVVVVVNSLPQVIITGDSTLCIGDGTLLTAGGALDYLWSTGDVTSSLSITPLVTTPYNVSGTDTNGCTNNAVINITVNALPQVTISGDSVTCIGDITPLTANGAQDYVWSTGDSTASVNVSPLTNEFFGVVGTDVNGCADTGYIFIVVNSLPTVSLTSPEDTACVNYSPILLSGSPSGGTYQGTGVGGGPSFNPSGAGVGTHEIVYTYADVFGCINSDTVSISVLACLGTEEETVLHTTIYPNPTTGQVQLKGLWDADVKVEVMDLNGRTLWMGIFAPAFTIPFSLEGYAPGVYQVRITSGQQAIVKQVVLAGK